jgi:hypothetical protein
VVKIFVAADRPVTKGGLNCMGFAWFGIRCALENERILFAIEENERAGDTWITLLKQFDV